MALPVAETAWPYAAPDPRVLVVIPTYNEIENIDEVLRRTRRALPDATVLVVDDNSPDGTADRVDALRRPLGDLEELEPAVVRQELGFHDDAVGVVDPDFTLERDRAEHVRAHHPPHVRGYGVDLVERALPLGDDEAGLLLDLAREAGDDVDVGVVDHAARRRPVGVAAPADVADEQQVVVDFEQRARDDPFLGRRRCQRPRRVTGRAPPRAGACDASGRARPSA